MSFLKKLFGGAPKDPNAGSLDAHMEYLNTLRRPAVHLRATDTPGFNKLGGVPDLPAGFEWPAWKGKPMMFLCQVDLGEVARLLPEIEMPSGKLYFFYDQMMDTAGSPEERGSWAVKCVPVDAGSSPAQVPEGLPPKKILKEKHVSLARIDTYPDSENEQVSSLPLTGRQWDTYCDIHVAIFDDEPSHHLFGYTQPIQSDGIELQCQIATGGRDQPDSSEWQKRSAEARKEWMLLFQFDMDDDIGYMWADGGRHFFCIRKDDLRAGRFENVWMIAECH